MSLILFVVGPPGVGKTTLVRGLLGPLGIAQVSFTEPPAPKWTYTTRKLGDNIAAAGWYKGETFDGADTIPYNGAAKALAYWNENLADKVALTIFDGARFSTGNSLASLRGAAEERGDRIIGVYLEAGDDELTSRRAARGSNQDPSWMKGASTGARNFATKIDATRVDAGAPVEELLVEVRDLIMEAKTRAS